MSLNQDVWHDHATMQQDVLLHFWVIFYIEFRLKYEKNILLSSSRAFSLSTPTFHCLSLWKTVRLHGKKLQNATKIFFKSLLFLTLEIYFSPSCNSKALCTFILVCNSRSEPKQFGFESFQVHV